MSRRRSALVALALVPLFVAACSDGDGSSASSTDATSVDATSAGTGGLCRPDTTLQATDDLPKVSLVRTAIEALEAKLGGPQQYFEVNATARVVNLFVALNGGTVAQAWVYVDGQLTSQEGQPASGGTFQLSDLDFQPETVLATVQSQIAGATLESFYVHGDGKGNVEYGVLASSQCGGGFDIIVGPDGAIRSVDPTQ